MKKKPAHTEKLGQINKKIIAEGEKLPVVKLKDGSSVQPNTLTRRLQNTIQPLWQHMACGCHVNRDTLQALRASGFILESKSIGYGGFPNFLGPVYRGIGSLLKKSD